MKKILLNKTARVISEMFNGFLMMILTPTLAFAFSSVSLLYKIIFPMGYLLITLLPFLILKRLGKVSDYEFSKREERPAYFTTVTIGYLVMFLLTTLLKDTTLTSVTLAIFTTTCVLTIVNLYWKMSGHMTYSTLFFFTLLLLFPYTPYLPWIFVVTPLIAASRVILKKHTIMQVVTGTLVSAILSILILWVI